MSQHYAESVDSDESDRYDDVGITRGQAIAETPLGSTRTISSITTREWVFILITGSAIIASACFAVYFLVVNASNPNDDFTLALLLLLNAGFTLFYLVDGVFIERANELIVLMGTVLLLIAYIVANFIYSAGWHQPIKVARLAVAGALAPVSIVLGGLIAAEYISAGNFIFRRVGADLGLQRACRRLFVAESGAKFDLQCTLSVVLLVVNGGAFNLFEKLILGIGTIFSLIWTVLLIVAMRAESIGLVAALLLLGIAQPVYMSMSLIADVQLILNATAPIIPENVDFSDSLPTVSVAASAFALAVRLMLMALVVVVSRGFGQGLKRKLLPPILRKCFGEA